MEYVMDIYRSLRNSFARSDWVVDQAINLMGAIKTWVAAPTPPYRRKVDGENGPTIRHAEPPPAKNGRRAAFRPAAGPDASRNCGRKLRRARRPAPNAPCVCAVRGWIYSA